MKFFIFLFFLLFFNHDVKFVLSKLRFLKFDRVAEDPVEELVLCIENIVFGSIDLEVVSIDI